MEIRWSNSFQLKYNDFIGPKNINNKLSAKSYVGIDYRYQFIEPGNLYRFKTFAFFLPRRSSIIIKNEYVLNHEQRHFDIAECYSIILNNLVDSLVNERIITYKNHDKKIDEICMHFFKFNYYPIQDLYDLETNHSLDTMSQTKWNNIIDSMLYLYRKDTVVNNLFWKEIPIPLDIILPASPSLSK